MCFHVIELLDFRNENILSKITLTFIFIGLVIGFSKSAGVLTLISILGSMWVGNSISGVITGEIQTIAGMHADVKRIVCRVEEPFDFHIEVIFEFVIGAMALTYFFKNV